MCRTPMGGKTQVDEDQSSSQESGRWFLFLFSSFFSFSKMGARSVRRCAIAAWREPQEASPPFDLGNTTLPQHQASTNAGICNRSTRLSGRISMSNMEAKWARGLCSRSRPGTTPAASVRADGVRDRLQRRQLGDRVAHQQASPSRVRPGPAQVSTA